LVIYSDGRRPSNGFFDIVAMSAQMAVPLPVIVAPMSWPWGAIDPETAARWLDGVVAGPLETLGAGDFCVAFRARGEVIRVARHPEAAAALRREAEAMAIIADRLPVPVPRPVHVDDGSRPPFSRHAEIRGAELLPREWASMRAGPRRALAVQLAAFMTALHAVEPTPAMRAVWPRVTLAGLSHRALAGLPAWRAHLDAATIDRLVRQLGAWAGEAPAADVILHGDLGVSHLLYDPATARLTGVIDFGDLMLGDPARDFLGLRDDFPPVILAEVLEAYPVERPDFRRRVGRWYVADTLAWLADADDADRRVAAAAIREELPHLED
jgi:aminoglycoside phosphotransferase